MFNNKYQHINSLTLIKSMRPRKAIVPQGPDLGNFIAYSDDLNLLCNFGMEMMKFLPRFEVTVCGLRKKNMHAFHLAVLPRLARRER